MNQQPIYFYDWATILILAMLIYGEAVGEPRLGKIGVAWVVMNRVDSKRMEFSYRRKVNWTSVMLRPGAFSCFNSGDVNREKLIDLFLSPEDPRQYYANECMEIAQAVYDGEVKDPTNGALFYVNKRLAGKLKWMKKLEKTIVIGRHVFYKYKKED